MKRIQSGFTSLLFILLVGMALTVATIGYVASIKTMQSSAVTTHAQTQAQMQTMVGYQVLSEFLKDSNVKVDTISTGTVNSTGQVINYQKPTSGCPTGTGHYCFDIIGESGGAKAILRALFKITNSLKYSNATGSIFAGGLNVQGNAVEFVGIGSDVSISVGDAGQGAGVIVGNKVGTTVQNIKISAYNGGTIFPEAASLRPYANYIFTKNSDGNAVCYKNNLRSGGSDIDTETQMKKGTNPNPDECPLIGHGVSLSGSTWSFNSSTANLAGVIWFDGDVILDLNETPSDYVNTVLSTGYVTTNLIDKKTNYNIYASNHYLLENVTDANIKTRLLKVCPADNYPLQYCQPYNATNRASITSLQYFKDYKGTFIKDTTDINNPAASLSNILFLADSGFALDAANKSTVNFYGNIMGLKAAGGTGMASGKIVGTGVLNITGNITVTGDLDVTQMQGNVKFILTNSKAGGDTTPVAVKSVTSASISYQ